MRWLRLMLRLFFLKWVVIRYQLDQLFFPKWCCVSWWLSGCQKPKQNRADRLFLAFSRLGPVFIKFGQMLSMRQDLIPADCAKALSQLQDQVNPLPFNQLKPIIESHISSIESIFSSFDKQPMASASIAQVHRAVLLAGGQSVVVKVCRPGIKQAVAQDFLWIRAAAWLLQQIVHDGHRLHVTEVVHEIHTTIEYEMDFMREAASMSVFARNFAQDDRLKVPTVYWDYTSSKVLVQQEVKGLSLNDMPRIQSSGIDVKALAILGIELFFTQVFQYRLFHADMHLGNLLVQSPDQGFGWIFMDFGITGSLNDRDQRYIAENLLAFLNRDYREVARLHVDSGWVDQNIRIDQFEAAIRTVCEPIFAKPLGKISFGELMLNLFQTARDFNVNIQPQLILLQKTLWMIESIGRTLDPDLNLWQAAKPMLEKAMKDSMGLRGLAKKTKANLPYWLEKAPDMPGLVHQFLALECDKATHRPSEKNVQRSSSSRWWMIGSFIVGALSVVGALSIFAI
jgi:ubiquinone biosynthesis protein